MEQVFVVRRSDFFASAWPQGFLPASGPEAAELLARLASAGFFVDRAEAEREPALKQLIPYCVLRRPGELFWVRRKAAGGEARLHGCLSIGLGGHVNPDESGETGSPDLFRAALGRELTEELDGSLGLAPVFVGLLNDDRDEVGRVHAGLVYVADLPLEHAPIPTVREISKLAGGFGSLAALDELWQDPARFESWSRILIEAGISGTGSSGNWAVTGSGRSESARRHDGREETIHG